MCFAGRVDGDAFPAFDGLRRPWNGHDQDPVLKHRTNPFLVDVPVERQLALKAAVKSLAKGSILRFVFELFLSADGQLPILQ